MKTPRLPLLVCASALSLCAHAIDLRPGGVFVQGGVAEHASFSATVGVMWPWSWRSEMAGGEWTGISEAFASYWSARAAGGRESFTQLGLLPLLRYRFAKGSSGWFLEGGIGISAMDTMYRTTDKQFSTRFNFVDVVGVGRSFGAQRARELSLRLSHISNGGIKKPNPGENFLQLRYAVLF